MKVIIYSAKTFEKDYFPKVNRYGHELLFVSQALSAETAALAKGCDAAVISARDDAWAKPLEALKQNGVKYLVTRANGYDNVDVKKASELRMRVANVPAYSPNAVAEHTLALILALNRKLIIADRQVHNYNFSAGNLVGFDLNNKIAGIIGTGKIGGAVAKILHGFGCRLVAYDPYPDIELTRSCHVNYVSLEQLCSTSDIITIHTPVNAGTRYLINKNLIDEMKPGVMLVNTANSGVVNTSDVHDALKSGCIGYFGTDVYEYEKEVFFFDHSSGMPGDTLLAQLLGMPNVLITPNQGFVTNESLAGIATTSFYTLYCWQNSQQAPNELTIKTRGSSAEQPH